MKTLDFWKFDGAGNDFILIDVRAEDPQLSVEQVAMMCHRRFGIGADGLMTLGRPVAEGAHFEMKYYNSDGRLGSMCGNGGRCIAAFAHLLGVGDGQRQLCFEGYDGLHEAEILVWDDTSKVGVVRLGMRDVPRNEVLRCLDGWFLDTGSPHYVQRVEGLDRFDVEGEGRRIRNIASEFPEGTNVDFIENREDGMLMVRTYERGVEAETWACGTGVTACAIVTGSKSLVTRGGDFKVDFEVSDSHYHQVRLTGPVSLNFVGKWHLA